ncbi:nucleotidyl transferase AbiEii/AbiGii toxin family protein [Laspinema palackyanum]|uniref:nucleotidyl transferase AbiEii/AbiGii toxin family protein n=1 Tax=Laspinema palackyanum TaxID=3231601 RepID=UPI00345D6ACD|nr:nucleotidyl transferase AbiEii/AbiGii toxin family protein [Laspinema sp. D2c]
MKILDPKEKQVLVDLKAVLDSLNLPRLMVGAGARLLIFDRQYNREGRATKDWDFAVSVDSWSDFQTLCDRLTLGKNPRFKGAHKVPHKFIHLATGGEVDIVPFGEIGQPGQEIEWEDGLKMNLLGLEEALLYAKEQVLDNDLVLPVVEPPAFLGLKLIAWSDRGGNKDLKDIDFMIEGIADSGIYENRVFEELVNEISEGQVEYLAAPTFLLGRDIRRIFRDATVSKINEILSEILENRDTVIPQLIPRTVADDEEWDDRFDAIVRRFEVLQRGILSRPSPDNT